MSELAKAQDKNPADDSEEGNIIAVFPTNNGNFKYVLDTEDGFAVQSLEREENLFSCRPNLM